MLYLSRIVHYASRDCPAFNALIGNMTDEFVSSESFPFVLWFLEAIECFCSATYVLRATVKGLRSGTFSTAKNSITERCLSSTSENCDTWLTSEHCQGILMNWQLHVAEERYRTERGRIVFINFLLLEFCQKNRDCRFCFHVAVTEV